MTPEMVQVGINIIQVIILPLLALVGQQVRSVRADIRALEKHINAVHVSLAQVNGRLDNAEAWQKWHETLFLQRQHLTEQQT